MGKTQDNPSGKAPVGLDCILEATLLRDAATSYLQEYQVDPVRTMITNVQGSINLLRLALENNVRILQASTSEVYGTAQFVPITELHPKQPQSPYSASKIGADAIADSFYRSFDLPITIVRPFNTFGPRQSARAVIPTIITQIASGAKQIKLGSLNPTRDFTYVTDTIEAFKAVACCDNAVGQVINVGSNFEISIGETAQLITEIMGANIEMLGDPQRFRPERSEVERLFASNERLCSMTDWTLKFNGLDGFRRGLYETIDWFTKPENLAYYKTNL